jgi:excinuclease UvrABC ATPase subunit
VPYRRLPNTDVARLKALKAAVDKAAQLELNELAFDSRYIHPLRNFHQELESYKYQQTQSWRKLVDQNKQFQLIIEKTRMYLTHFVQVLNMSVAREELTQETRKFYGLDPTDQKIPKMISNEDLFQCGKQIIEGEAKRVRTGGTPIMNPTIGKVKVWYDKFKDLYHSQQIANKTYQRVNQQLLDARRKSDALIPIIWNEIEEHFSDHPDEERRILCEEYGIVYVFRKNEKIPN